ncbi:MAG: DUF881 domain-containing protein [Bacillota bacterium]|nr:DUF881 domain-containing protein [Bacillota bacterium]MDW7676469.1 DUF881 domain-containing protein [Bacillota bacterium]
MNKKFRNVMVVLVFMVAGLLVTLQFKSVGSDYSFITIQTMSELQNAVTRERDELKQIQLLIKAQEDKLSNYEAAIASEGSIQEILLQDIELMKIHIGVYDLEGPGVMVLLSDSDRELYEGEDPNNVIVHDADVLKIMNDLKTAGAEALSINGQRVLSTSEIQCAGATITINQFTYAQPFVIKAIGNPDLLNAAVKAPQTYAWELMEVYGLRVESHVSERVRIPRYHGQQQFQYISVKDGE